jgi:hypothetical protein
MPVPGPVAHLVERATGLDGVAVLVAFGPEDVGAVDVVAQGYGIQPRWLDEQSLTPSAARRRFGGVRTATNREPAGGSATMSQTDVHPPGSRHHPHRRSRSRFHEFDRVYFDYLASEYQILPPGAGDPEARRIVEAILHAPKHHRADLHPLELSLLKLRPIDRLRRDVWAYRDRVRDVAGRPRYVAYLASSPPDPRTAPEAEVRADLEHLVGELHWYYGLQPVRERFRIRFIRYISTLLFVLAAAFIAYLAIVHREHNPSLVLVLFTGLVGATMSVLHRMEQVQGGGDPIATSLAWEQAQGSLFFAPFSGAIFAAILYLIFGAGLLQGIAFPEIATAGRVLEGAGDYLSFPDFVRHTGPVSGLDWFKLLLWSFAAGFAERLVPDAIDRIVARSQRGGSGGTAAGED